MQLGSGAGDRVASCQPNRRLNAEADPRRDGRPAAAQVPRRGDLNVVRPDLDRGLRLVARAIRLARDAPKTATSGVRNSNAVRARRLHLAVFPPTVAIRSARTSS